jgi:hypothetical protein
MSCHIFDNCLDEMLDSFSGLSDKELAEIYAFATSCADSCCFEVPIIPDYFRDFFSNFVEAFNESYTVYKLEHYGETSVDAD